MRRQGNVNIDDGNLEAGGCSSHTKDGELDLHLGELGGIQQVHWGFGSVITLDILFEFL